MELSRGHASGVQRVTVFMFLLPISINLMRLEQCYHKPCKPIKRTIYKHDKTPDVSKCGENVEIKTKYFSNTFKASRTPEDIHAK